MSAGIRIRRNQMNFKLNISVKFGVLLLLLLLLVVLLLLLLSSDERCR